MIIFGSHFGTLGAPGIPFWRQHGSKMTPKRAPGVTRNAKMSPKSPRESPRSLHEATMVARGVFQGSK